MLTGGPLQTRLSFLAQKKKTFFLIHHKDLKGAGDSLLGEPRFPTAVKALRITGAQWRGHVGTFLFGWPLAFRVLSLMTDCELHKESEMIAFWPWADMVC